MPIRAGIRWGVAFAMIYAVWVTVLRVLSGPGDVIVGLVAVDAIDMVSCACIVVLRARDVQSQRFESRRLAMLGRQIVAAGAVLVLFGVMPRPSLGQDLLRIRRQAILAFAGRTAVGSLLHYAEELGLTTEQMARLQVVEDQTGTANRKLLERNGIRIDMTADDSASAEIVYVERSLLLALRENVRLGAVRARLILNARQRALERDMVTSAVGRREQLPR